MALACTRWGWSAENFWQATPQDMRLIFSGLQALNEDPNALQPDDISHLRSLIATHNNQS